MNDEKARLFWDTSISCAPCKIGHSVFFLHRLKPVFSKQQKAYPQVLQKLCTIKDFNIYAFFNINCFIVTLKRRESKRADKLWITPYYVELQFGSAISACCFCAVQILFITFKASLACSPMLCARGIRVSPKLQYTHFRICDFKSQEYSFSANVEPQNKALKEL